MEPSPWHSGFGSLIGRFGRLVWLICQTCRVEFAIDRADYEEEVH
jgi:hypothetical protein